MTRIRNKRIASGFVIGLIANCIGVVLYLLLFTEESVLGGLRTAYQNDFLGSVLTMGAIPNLLVFMKFLQQNKVYQARGVVLATLLSALFTVYLKFVA
jgi:energy-converting hydrogenase Eha subunit A